MIDTLRYSKILEAAGVSREHAEAHVRIIADVIEGNLATKQDLRELEYRLIIKLGAMVAGVSALVIAILGFLITQH